jgi:hypothetical protein
MPQPAPTVKINAPILGATILHSAQRFVMFRTQLMRIDLERTDATVGKNQHVVPV